MTWNQSKCPAKMSRSPPDAVYLFPTVSQCVQWAIALIWSVSCWGELICSLSAAIRHSVWTQPRQTYFVGLSAQVLSCSWPTVNPVIVFSLTFVLTPCFDHCLFFYFRTVLAPASLCLTLKSLDPNSTCFKELKNMKSVCGNLLVVPELCPDKKAFCSYCHTSNHW